MVCSSCQTENSEGSKFCRECGSALALRCPSCGSGYESGQKFCQECGSALAAPSTPSRGVEPRPAAVSGAPAVSERRLVSVLFRDLVGFTTLSESRDPEEVRELLSLVFRSVQGVDRPVWRDGGEVHWGCGDGGVGDSCGA